MPSKTSPGCWGVVPAAGRGLRMANELPKQYLPLAGKTVLEHTLQRMLGWEILQRVVVVLDAADTHFAQLAIASHEQLLRADGGAQRSASVLAGLQALSSLAQDDDWVLVHDAARPCVTGAEVMALYAALEQDPVGGLLALPVTETVKRDNGAQQVAATVERSGLWLAQTPQMFRYALLRDSLQAALAAGHHVTDEASALEWAGYQPRLVAGASSNIKITRPHDLLLAELWLQQGEL